MGKLEDLRVERVDGVDRPATGHRFVIVKSERTAAQLLAELEKSDELTDEQRELVESFKATLEDEPEEPAASEEGVEKDEHEDDPAEPVEKDEPAAEETPAVELTDESLRETIKSVLTELIESELAETEEPESVEKAAGTVKSRQPAEQQREAAPVAKAKGEGMFSNIIFGQGRR